jgi:hypothetical protein
MLNSVSNLVSQPYFYIPVMTIATCAITYKIYQITKPIFVSLGQKIYQNTFFTNFRALFCRKCADSHRSHLISVKVNPENQFVVTKTDLENKGVKRIPTPMPSTETIISHQLGSNKIPENLMTPFSGYD